MAKIKSYGSGIDSGGANWGTVYAFHCPGCGFSHPYHVGGDPNLHPQWEFNGDMNRPTFRPSLVVFRSDPARQCHLFVTNGKIEFLGDCHHKLAGQTVEIPEWDD